jgi:putative aldouronate transport system permease protein
MGADSSGAIQVYNMILARTFFAGIPESMSESASIDGANDVTILSRIILPLSMPIIAVLILFYAVGHWNTYFNALLYLPDQKLQPLQMYLVRLLVENEQLLAEGGEDTMEMAMQNIKTKYATIIVVVAPILCVYPFLQKYFVQGGYDRRHQGIMASSGFVFQTDDGLKRMVDFM